MVGYVAEGMSLKRNTTSVQDLASSPKAFVRPPFPLANGTTYAALEASDSTVSLRTGNAVNLDSGKTTASSKPRNASVLLAPGYAQFQGTTFKSMCPSTDASCRQTCTAMVSACSIAHGNYKDSTEAWTRSFESKHGNKTYPLTTVHVTRTERPIITSTYSITYIESLLTTVTWNRISSTTVAIVSPECLISSCAKDAQSTPSVSLPKQLASDLAEQKSDQPLLPHCDGHSGQDRKPRLCGEWNSMGPPDNSSKYLRRNYYQRGQKHTIIHRLRSQLQFHLDHRLSDEPRL